MTAFVVAIAGIMFPAIAEKKMKKVVNMNAKHMKLYQIVKTHRDKKS